MLVIAVIIAGVIGFFAEFLFRMMFQGGWRWGGGRSNSGDSDRGKGGGGAAIVIAIALVAVAWLLSVVIRFALSRKREYLADAGSVELTKDPDAMISALRKIEGRGELEGATSAVMEMCIDNPREGFADLFATHPSIESRIAALVQYAGGRDPGPLALPDAQESSENTPEPQEQPAPGPWSGDAPAPNPSGSKPFLPSEPPVTLGGSTPPGQPPGPWGPSRQN
jgi:heat shock protein HtpX